MVMPLCAGRETTFSGACSTLPMLACLLAKRAYDFHFTWINVAGGVEPGPIRIPHSSSDPAIVEGAPAIFANQDFYDLCARGGLDLVYLGCAQIDAEGRRFSACTAGRRAFCARVVESRHHSRHSHCAHRFCIRSGLGETDVADHGARARRTRRTRPATRVRGADRWLMVNCRE